jgi:2-dehydropantoate 2-reductase
MEKMETLIKHFQESHVNVIAVKDMQEVRWHKLLWNASFNPISILAGERNCEQLLKNQLSRDLVLDVMHEVKAVAEKSIGRSFGAEFESIEKYLELTVKLGDYKPSMLIDWQTNRPMEIQAILGNAIKKGESLDMKMPILSVLLALLKLKQKK